MLRTIFFITYFTVCAPSVVCAQGLRDVKPPVDLPSSAWFLALFVAVLLTAALWWFAFRRIKFQKVTTPKPEARPTPWQIADERLNELKAQNLPAKGEVKEFFTILSEIIRFYMEGRFLIRAPEMTTQEFLYNLNQSGSLSEEYRRALKEFLECSDMVKFAKHHSDVNEMEKSFQLARKIVDETRPDERIALK